MNWGLFVALDDVVEIGSKCLAYIVLMDIGIDEMAGFIVKLPHAALGIFYTAVGLGLPSAMSLPVGLPMSALS